MKRALLLFLVVCGILTGCVNNKVSVSEIDLENAKDTVKIFIEKIEEEDKGTGNGIYIYNDSKNRRYLYISQDFFDDGRGFGAIDIKTGESSVNIYLSDISIADNEADTYKLYKIDLDKDYEYIKVFKNGEETHFASVGVGG